MGRAISVQRWRDGAAAVRTAAALLALLAAGACGSEGASSRAATDAATAEVAGDTAAAADADATGLGDAAATCALPSLAGPGRVATDRGWVQGEQAGQTWAFRGIPFAAPPLGALRFAKPAPAPCWSDVRAASAFAPACTQLDPKTGQPTGSEDCLYLNVWTPQQAGKAPWPVLVFVHGGGNVQGSASETLPGGEPIYDGRRLAEQGAVVVTLQYRLGVFGNLSLGELDGEFAAPSGNQGLRDLLAGLQWLQANAAAFGGDPGRVLLFGESAGAVNTCALLATPASKGLFHAALLQSGGCSQPTAAAFRAALEPKLAASSCGKAADRLGCLRALPAADLAKQLAGSVNIGAAAPAAEPGRYGPIVDGSLLPQSPLAALQDGSAHAVPLVVGVNGEELDKLLAVKVADQAGFDAAVQAGFASLGAPAVAALQAAYAPGQFASAQAALVQLYSDLRFVCPARGIARAALAGRAARGAKAGVWRYLFSQQAASKQGKLAAAHAIELLSVFGTLGDIPLYTPAGDDVALAAAIQGYWLRLAAQGDPNGAGATAWPGYAAGSDRALELRWPLQAIDGVHADKCDLWEQLLAGAPP